MMLLLSVVMVLCVLGGCNNVANTSNESVQNSSNPDESNVSSSQDEELYKADIPESLAFEGEEFVILSSYAGDPSSVIYPFFGGNGEFESSVVNDAVITRNLVVEDRLKLKIVENMFRDTNRYGGGALHEKVETAININIIDFDMISASLYNCAKLTAAGYLQDLVSLEYLHELSSPWWRDSFNKEIEVDGRIYYTTGDISFSDIAGTFCLTFNKTVQNNYEIPDFYELVRTKKWTMDEFFKQGKKIGGEVVSDGTFDYQDRIGITGQSSMMWALMYSGGERIGRMGDDGYPTLTINTERNINLIQDAIEVLGNHELFLNANNYFNITNTPIDLILENFFGDRSLYYGGSVGQIATALKDMESDFGVLPYPMYDESQDDYYSLISPYTGDAVCVPANHTDERLELIAATMEMMGAEGKNYISDAYCETTLKEQKTRDEGSLEMLDLIMKTTGCDIGQAYQWGGFPRELQQMVSNNNSDFAHIYDSLKDRAQSELDETIQSLKNQK